MKRRGAFTPVKYSKAVRRRRNLTGFTLIELLIVIAIISIASAFILFSVKNGRSRARDSQRMSDLTALDSAIKMYYKETGHYPSLPGSLATGGTGCGTKKTFNDLTVSWINEDSSSNVTTWQSGKCLTSDFIPGLVPKYISKLPVDPGPNYSASGSGNDRGYIYIHKVLATGIECYKIMSHQPENAALPASKNIWDPQRDDGTDPNAVDGSAPWAWSYYSRGCAFDNGGHL